MRTICFRSEESGKIIWVRDWWIPSHVVLGLVKIAVLIERAWPVTSYRFSEGKRTPKWLIEFLTSKFQLPIKKRWEMTYYTTMHSW